MHIPSSSSVDGIYGSGNIDAIRIVTLAPELPEELDLIQILTQHGLQVSIGHSAATYAQGAAGIEAGASLLTHTFNAMNSLHHREPGLPGKIAFQLVQEVDFHR
ncbi:hypothetical protein BJ878DRAFT_485695 [Calycina marina]|uniref:N-acetylglucosamine-6-phosphate deacetylase n=1 Tax=Calycina marina TaxID=1763456 RepID=A0A9P7ZBE8_9HELO|nr:hypothetical protein BJ878DRAFT_485695 [Calycina marina]